MSVVSVEGNEGKTLGAVTLQGTGGKTWNLPEDLKSEFTLLYFYPRDNTPGCTKQACAYRDATDDFKELGVEVLGVSKDSLDSHENFADKYQLSFPLLSDSEGKLAAELEVTGRDTFLLRDTGRVVAEWRKVSPMETAQITLEAIKKIKL